MYLNDLIFTDSFALSSPFIRAIVTVFILESKVKVFSLRIKIIKHTESQTESAEMHWPLLHL